MRPARKARGGRIPGVCNRRATPRPGMQRRPNVTGLPGHDTRSEIARSALSTSRRFSTVRRGWLSKKTGSPTSRSRTKGRPNQIQAGRDRVLKLMDKVRKARARPPCPSGAAEDGLDHQLVIGFREGLPGNGAQAPPPRLPLIAGRHEPRRSGPRISVGLSLE